MLYVAPAWAENDPAGDIMPPREAVKAPKKEYSPFVGGRTRLHLAHLVHAVSVEL